MLGVGPGHIILSSQHQHRSHIFCSFLLYFYLCCIFVRSMVKVNSIWTISGHEFITLLGKNLKCNSNAISSEYPFLYSRSSISIWVMFILLFIRTSNIYLSYSWWSVALVYKCYLGSPAQPGALLFYIHHLGHNVGSEIGNSTDFWRK